jgi:murein DD-endopeptidase MepM/ murein hydrolase activator NlpD
VQLTIKKEKVGGKVSTSLNQAMASAGERSTLVAKFVDLFAWDINWYIDPREGDEFRIVVEKHYQQDKFYRYGRILAAEYRGKCGRYQAFYFVPQGSSVGGYYTAEGRNLRRAFLKTPLTFRRISSLFNMRRFHPILHKTKGHYGVDYAATQGTPVWAAADGKVLMAGYSGGAGNLIVLLHRGGITSEYMHLFRFASGLRRGQNVKQQQVIGYVGSTGLSTGPHLHYGLKEQGQPVDPLKFTVGQGPVLPSTERARFLHGLPERMAELGAILPSPATS